MRHGMKVDEIYDLISFGKSMWFEKCIEFNTQKRNIAKNDSTNYSKTQSMEKQWEMYETVWDWNLIKKMVLKKFLNNNQN